MVTQLEESQRQLNDALAVCKSAIEANDPSQASYFSLKIEPDFREAKKALEEKSVCIHAMVTYIIYRKVNYIIDYPQEQTADPFNDKEHGFSNGTDNEFKTNQFATTFDEYSTGFGGFDDGFGSSFTPKTNDPFTANSTTQDPFGDKRSINTVSQDVSDKYFSFHT